MSKTVARKPFDPDPAWSVECKTAFTMYRDLGSERSLRATQEKLGRPSGYQRTLEEWSRQQGWVERVAAFDAHLDRVRVESAREQIERVTSGHAAALEAAIKVISRPILKLAERIEDGDLTDDDEDVLRFTLGTKEGAKLLPSLIQASRLVHGVSTQNVALNGQHRHRIERADLGELDAYLTGFDDGAKQLAESVD